MHTDDEHLDALTGAYALDALDDVERARVERHLAACEACAAEVRSFTETTARLAAGAATTPPSGLRDRVLAEAARTRQLPPALDDALPPSPRPARAARWVTVAAASLLVLSVGLGAVAWGQYREAERMRAVAAAMSDVMTDPGRQVVDAEFGAGTGTVLVSGDRVVLVGDDVPDPPDGQGYQLWFIGEDGARPSSMLTAAGSGRFWVDARGWAPGDAIGVTMEPSSGSRQPTTDPVLVARTAAG